MATNKQQVSVRVQPYTYEKFKVIAEKNNRSISQQVEFLMKQCIEKYELEYGTISQLVQSNNTGSVNFVANTEINMSGA